ncbi:hypothetical protein [Streptomyces sp. NPDC127084]|uniref:hypothetical protein n=1 Tax=Streptomyces sp. NPDC127084 TaxID=3347133 RepID=UPI00365985A5
MDLASPWKSDRFANRIRFRHATVHAMLEAGHSRRSIGRQLHMTHRTVKSLADATRPEDLFTGQYQFNRASAVRLLVVLSGASHDAPGNMQSALPGIMTYP